MPESNEKSLTGGCSCGECRYQLNAAPLFVHCCHCSWCQRESGATFALNAMLETRHVQLSTGRVEIIDTPSASGRGQGIARCPRCRVALWSHYASLREAMAFVRVGTLDEPAACPPDVHIFTASKQPWVVLDGAVPVCEVFYAREALWPHSSLQRFQALLDSMA